MAGVPRTPVAGAPGATLSLLAGLETRLSELAGRNDPNVTPRKPPKFATAAEADAWLEAQDARPTGKRRWLVVEDDNGVPLLRTRMPARDSEYDSGVGVYDVEGATIVVNTNRSKRKAEA